MIGALEEEIVFPYAFMNSDKNFIVTEMFCSEDVKKIEKQSKVLQDLQILLAPEHESRLLSHFKEIYVHYL